MLRGLVEQRGHQSNQIKDQNICINLTREANKSLSVAAKLNLPIKNIGIQANYREVASASEELSLTMNVVFLMPHLLLRQFVGRPGSLAVNPSYVS